MSVHHKSLRKTPREKQHSSTYDVCTSVKTFPVARQLTKDTFCIRGSPTFRIGRKIAEGRYGVIFDGSLYRGTLGEVPIAIKRNKSDEISKSTAEVEMQIRLYCHHVSERPQGLPGGAFLPKTFFAAMVPHFGHVIGMERVDESLIDRLQRGGGASPRVLEGALDKVSSLLRCLQDDLEFMHGDLHCGNVMFRKNDVILVDFGMSSAHFQDTERRTVADTRYNGVSFNPHLDLLTLVTSLREDLGTAGKMALAATCDAIVAPFWDAVREGLREALSSGTVPRDIPYKAAHTVASALAAWRKKGKFYYAHHLLYQKIGDVEYPPCHPRTFQASRPLREVPWKERFFDDLLR